MGVLGFVNRFDGGNDGLHVLHSGCSLEFQGVVLDHDFKVGYVGVEWAAALEAVLPSGWGLHRILDLPWSGKGALIDQVVLLRGPVGWLWSGGLWEMVMLLFGSVLGSWEGAVTRMKSLVGFEFIFWGPIWCPGVLGIAAVCTWLCITCRGGRHGVITGLSLPFCRSCWAISASGVGLLVPSGGVLIVQQGGIVIMLW